jgi:hydrogenase expression/formation protein HypC
MCLAVPMQVCRVLDDEKAVVRQGETELEISTALLQDVEVGDYVIVHAGFGIDILDLREAEERLALFREMREKSP